MQYQFQVYSKVIDIHTHISIHVQILFPIDYYRILSRVPCAILQVLFDCIFCIQQCVYVNSKLLIYPSLLPFPFGNHKFVFEVRISGVSLVIASLSFLLFIWDLSLFFSVSLARGLWIFFILSKKKKKTGLGFIYLPCYFSDLYFISCLIFIIPSFC